MAKQTGAFFPGWLPECGLPDQEWKLPLALAVAVHVVVLGLGLASPVLFARQPTLPEIQTVNLVNAVEPGPSHVRRQLAPVVIKPAHMIKAVAKKAPPAPPKAAPAKARAISERPLPSRTAEDLAKLQAIRHSLAAQQAREAEQLAKEQVNDAVANIRDLLHEENTAAPGPAAPQPMPAAEPAAPAGPTAAPGVPADGSGAVVQKALRRYLAAVHNRIHQHWSLPDLQSWNDSLEAVVVIKVRKDGTITDSFFEKRSDNTYFNQYVEETIREANPLPPFPPDLKKEQLEIGLRFRPGEIL